MILEVEKVEYSYEGSRWRLGPVSFSVDSGEVVGIVGPNGSGKSTLVKVAGGICKPVTGNVRLKGQYLASMSRRRIARTLGYLPQSVESAFNYKVEEVVAMGRYAYLEGMGFLSGEDTEQIRKSMELTATGKYANRHLNQLSGGERQRVLLASVLCQKPEILLLDEPTTGLDIHHQVSFFNILKNLSNEGLAIVVVTHDLNLAAMFCSKLLLIKGGTIVKSGNVEEVITEDAIGDLYPDNVFIGTHPVNGKPMVLPVAGGGDG